MVEPVWHVTSPASKLHLADQQSAGVQSMETNGDESAGKQSTGNQSAVTAEYQSVSLLDVDWGEYSDLTQLLQRVFDYKVCSVVSEDHNFFFNKFDFGNSAAECVYELVAGGKELLVNTSCGDQKLLVPETWDPGGVRDKVCGETCGICGVHGPKKERRDDGDPPHLVLLWQDEAPSVKTSRMQRLGGTGILMQKQAVLAKTKESKLCDLFRKSQLPV